MKKNLGLVAGVLFMLGLSACDSSEVISDGGNSFGNSKEQYVVMYSSGSVGYLMQVDDITSGTLDGTQNYHNRQQVTGNQDFIQVGYQSLYNINYASQSSNGTSTLSTSWRLDSQNQLTQRSELDLSGDIKSRGVWKNYIIGASSLSKGEPAKAYERVKIVDANNDKLVSNDGFVNTHAGEYDATIFPDEHVTFSDFASYGDYLLVGLKTKNSTAKGAKTKYEGNTYLAVYRYDGNSRAELERKTIIARKTSENVATPAGQIGGNSNSRVETGIEPVDDGSIYLFCQGISSPDVDRALPPSAVLRISDSNIVDGIPVAIDSDYYVNIQELSDGHRVWRSYYLGGTAFCLQMFTEGSGSTSGTKMKFAIFDAATKAFTWVEGVPATISDVSLPVLIEKEKNRVVFAIETTDQQPALYIVDKNAKMVRGLEIKAENIKGVAKLTNE